MTSENLNKNFISSLNLQAVKFKIYRSTEDCDKFRILTDFSSSILVLPESHLE